MKVRVNLVFGSSKHLKKYDKVFSGRIQIRTGQIFKGILWEIYDHCAEVLLHIEVGSLVQFGAVKIIKNLKKKLSDNQTRRHPFLPPVYRYGDQLNIDVNSAILKICNHLIGIFLIIEITQVMELVPGSNVFNVFSSSSNGP